MTYCENCGDQIGYLPFKCKYCGGTFCKKHRLPENHQCSFELKHVPLVPLSVKESQVHDGTETKVYIQEDYSKAPKALKKYLKRQEKQAKLTQKRTRVSFWGRSRIKGTKILIGLIVIISIMGLIFPEYFNFSLHSLIFDFMFHTILTSLFISSPGDLFGFFFFFIMLLFLYFISRGIELAYGTSFLIKLFLISGISSLLFYTLLRLSLISMYPLEFYAFYVGFAWGGIYGLLSYMIFPNANKQITALFY
ncbi:MAG: zinc finger AN1 domain-containing stress-associated protein, partial [Promethearchaeia archaeon]